MSATRPPQRRLRWRTQVVVLEDARGHEVGRIDAPVYGPFAVHPATGASEPPGTWIVTHVRWRRCLPWYWLREEYARQIVERLAALDWSAPAPSMDSIAYRRLVRAAWRIIEAWYGEWRQREQCEEGARCATTATG
jgi:hypothetical protein